MHRTKSVQYTDPVTLMNDEGDVYRYASKEEALTDLGLAWIQTYVREHFRKFLYNAKYYGDEREEAMYEVSNWIMRNGAGEPLTVTDFYPERKQRKSYWDGRFGTWNGDGPVPGTGHSRHRYIMYRRMHTVAAKRESFVIEADGEPKMRAARSGKYLPDSWDEYFRSCNRDVNWKRFRKNQYKE